MEDEGLNYIVEYDLDNLITNTGIYWCDVSIESYKVVSEAQGFKKRQITFLSKHESKEVYSEREKEISFRKFIKTSPEVVKDANKRLSKKNILLIKIRILKYLGEIQRPTEEWQQKSKTLKENTKTLSTSLPPITNFVSMSLHRSMSLEDL